MPDPAATSKIRKSSGTTAWGVEQDADTVEIFPLAAEETEPDALLAAYAWRSEQSRVEWRYRFRVDGVLHYAPDASYGTPDDFRRLVDAAHGHGLAVTLDVVYNHFGPDGNYLPGYAPTFFDTREQTPWGAAIGFAGPGSKAVRCFYVENAVTLGPYAVAPFA
ncbi:MAG: alpha-amylase family glycosyl hydrolase [Lautropia sp.]